MAARLIATGLLLVCGVAPALASDAKSDAKKSQNEKGVLSWIQRQLPIRSSAKARREDDLRQRLRQAIARRPRNTDQQPATPERSVLPKRDVRRPATQEVTTRSQPPTPPATRPALGHVSLWDDLATLANLPRGRTATSATGGTPNRDAQIARNTSSQGNFAARPPQRSPAHAVAASPASADRANNASAGVAAAARSVPLPANTSEPAAHPSPLGSPGPSSGLLLLASATVAIDADPRAAPQPEVVAATEHAGTWVAVAPTASASVGSDAANDGPESPADEAAGSEPSSPSVDVAAATTQSRAAAPSASVAATTNIAPTAHAVGRDHAESPPAAPPGGPRSTRFGGRALAYTAAGLLALVLVLTLRSSGRTGSTRTPHESEVCAGVRTTASLGAIANTGRDACAPPGASSRPRPGELFGPFLAGIGLAIAAVGVVAIARACLAEQAGGVRLGMHVAAGGQFVLLLGLVSIVLERARRARVAAALVTPAGHIELPPPRRPTHVTLDVEQVAQLQAQVAHLSQQLERLSRHGADR